MNANEISPKANSRITRIKKVSYLFRIIFLTATLLGAIWTLTAIFSCVASRSLMNVFLLGFTLTCTLGVWNGYRLFYNYSRGDLFTSKSIESIRRIGYCCFLLGLQSNFSRAMSHFGGLKDPLFPLIAGFIIIFIAWIMDEGRKIQEEQELTV